VSNPSILNPFVTPNETTTYTLTAIENGCTLSDQVTIFIQESLLFPTTFSPNNDGANDKWEIGAIDLYPDCFVRIFNRWGQEIYQSTGYSKEKAWDGTNSNGSPLAEGVYFYVVDLRDEEKQQFKGSITLIR
jgi:gliding motility-associated-like protein